MKSTLKCQQVPSLPGLALSLASVILSLTLLSRQSMLPSRYGVVQLVNKVKVVNTWCVLFFIMRAYSLHSSQTVHFMYIHHRHKRENLDIMCSKIINN